MVLYKGADASIPGNPLPAGTKILAAYVGAKDLPEPPDTPHIWTLEEWNLYLNPDSHLYVPDLRVLPIYVHNFVTTDPSLIAQNMVDAVVDLGWKSVDSLDRTIVFDTETLVDPDFVDAVDKAVNRLGFRLTNYGSYDFIIRNGFTSGGKWPALLTTRPPRTLPLFSNGQQWQFGEEWDSDVFDEFIYDLCGRGMRNGRN